MGQFQTICRRDSAPPIRRIAYPIKFSSSSEHGLNWAVQLAQDYQAELLLLHVLPRPTPIFEIESPMKSQAEFALSVLLSKLQSTDIKARGFLLTGTNSVDCQIIRAARLARVDIIVMGTRGRSGFYRLFAGSLASRLIARAHCPVLVVPASRAELVSAPK